MKKSRITTITTILFFASMVVMVILAAILWIGGSKKTEKTVDMKVITVSDNEEVFEETLINEEKETKINPIAVQDAGDYIRNIRKLTNLAYTGDVTDYEYDGYTFKRFDTFVTINQSKEETVYLGGYDFLLSDDGKVWFIDNERKISSYDYNTAEIIVHESADLYGTKVDNWFSDQKHMKIAGTTTAVTAYNFPYTVLVQDNKIAAYGRKGEYAGNFKNEIFFPFQIVELTSTYQERYKDKEWKINFISDTNVVGQIVFTEEGVDYNIVDASNAEKSLYHSEDLFVNTRGNWVVYEKNGELVASDGELSFSFDDMDYREMWFGDNCGIGRGYEEVAAVIIPVDYEKLTTMSIEELFIKYVK